MLGFALAIQNRDRENSTTFQVAQGESTELEMTQAKKLEKFHFQVVG